jgi:hypothetical protein
MVAVMDVNNVILLVRVWVVPQRALVVQSMLPVKGVEDVLSMELLPELLVVQLVLIMRIMRLVIPTHT